MFIPSWQCRDGRLIRLDQMTESHLHNCIAKILRSRRGWRREWLDALNLELEIRRIRQAS